MKMLLATDGSECSTAAIRKACNILSDGDSVHIVSAFEDSSPMGIEPFAVSPDFYQKVIDALKEIADRNAIQARESAQEGLKGKRVEITSDVIEGPPQKVIVDEAARLGSDLIVVGSHGRGFWGRMLGSVSNGVVHHAPCSVLVVR